MKRAFRFLSIVMVFALLGAMPVLADDTTSKASSYFMSYDSYLWKTSGNTFEVWFDVAACTWMDELGASTIEIQRSSDGSSWSTMRTYHSSTYPQMICENTTGHAGYVSYTGTQGYYYRAYVTFYAKNSSGSAIRFNYAETIRL